MISLLADPFTLRLIEAAPDAVVLVHGDGTIALVNSRAETMFGYPRQELAGQNVDLLVPERFRERHERYREGFFVQPEARPMGGGLDFYGRRRDGSEFPVEIGLSPLADTEETLAYAAIRDVSVHSRADATLLESERRLRLMADALPALIAYVDAEGRYRFCNAEYARSHGISLDEVQGRSMADVLGEEAARVLRPHVEAALSGEAVTFEKTLRRRDGGRRYFHGSYVPYRDRHGKVMGFYALILDITDKIRSEKELRQQREQLAHVSRITTLGELASAMAHELNQPLTAISANAQATRRFMRGGELGREELAEILEDLVNDAARAGEVIRRLRRLLKRGDLALCRIDVNDTLKAIEVFAQADALETEVEIVFDLAPKLPVILGDAIQLQQVFLNIIHNAMEAMREIATDRRLVIRTSVEESSVIVAVRDAGPPLADETRERMFDPFYTTKPDGMGMGLSISRSIVKAHGGQLWAEQNGDSGLTVSLTLPAAGDDS